MPWFANRSSMKLKETIKKYLPPEALDWYHQILAILGNLIYRFPSRRLIVIGVTGTKGKTTVCNMIWHILTEAGYKTGMTSTANIRIADKEWVNDTKMTMQGRFRLPRLLRQMVHAGCRYAVIETSSEGIKQHRHWGIRYQVAVFTNLTPEHIESHGSFENYRDAKGELFHHLVGQKTSIINTDDASADFFKAIPVRDYYFYALHTQADLRAEHIQYHHSGSTFEVKGHRFSLQLMGEFNIANALAAIAVGKSQKIDWRIMETALGKITTVPGRMEEITGEQGFSVVVDYAHTPESLEAVYKTLRTRARRLIAVLGSCGGGRDKAKRPKLGALAGKYADVAIITNEDPYNEDPEKIIQDVWDGLVDTTIEKYKISQRSDAIRKAIELARSGDIVVITGKGSEQHIVTAQGKQPWDDREVVRTVLQDSKKR